MNAIITPPQAEHITLYYREGSSDKVYQVSIEQPSSLALIPNPPSHPNSTGQEAGQAIVSSQ